MHTDILRLCQLYGHQGSWRCHHPCPLWWSTNLGLIVFVFMSESSLFSVLCHFPESPDCYGFISVIFYITPLFFSLVTIPQPPSLLKFNLQESIHIGPAPSSQHVASQWVSCLDVRCPDEFCHLWRKTVTGSETELPPISPGAEGLNNNNKNSCIKIKAAPVISVPSPEL